MTQETVLIIGLGEIGHTLFCLYSEKKHAFHVYGLDLDPTKMQTLNQDKTKIPPTIDILQIALPCENPEKFTQIIANYANQYQPHLIIINSTLPPKTTRKVAKTTSCLVVHSPARGVHISAEHMLWEMKRWPKYIGGATPQAAKIAKAHFEKLGLTVKVLKSCNETELAKIFETTYRAWMIVCFQEMHRISRAFDADFNDTVDFLEDTHRQRYDRPVMFPGYIGGHCLIPNTELLLSVYDSDFLRLILKSNQKRKTEMTDPEINAEAQLVANRAIALEKELSGTKNLTLPQPPSQPKPST
jgi:UDP-N-acetyl-D-mannosaminuronate dehydrogenase